MKALMLTDAQYQELREHLIQFHPDANRWDKIVTHQLWIVDSKKDNEQSDHLIRNRGELIGRDGPGSRPAHISFRTGFRRFVMYNRQAHLRMESPREGDLYDTVEDG